MATFYLLKNATNSQMFGAIVKTEQKTVVIDGGVPGDAQQLADFVREKTNSCVDAWFFTHAHYDHVGAFWEIRKRMPDIKVEKVYHDFPALEELKRLEPRTPWEMELWADMDGWVHEPWTHRLHAGEEFSFDDVTLKILRTYNPKIETNFVNNSSCVFRIDGKKSNVLILGDLGVEGGEEVMKLCDRESLHAEYTQMAHHGQDGVLREFYEYIRPKKCLWAAPAWLWDNDAGEGFDTGPWQTVCTREWVKALGVTEHYVIKDGTSAIEI